MTIKKHGTCPLPVQKNLRFGVDRTTADIISCYNENKAEPPGYAFQKDKGVEIEFFVAPRNQVDFYDSVTGKRLFIAPMGRDFQSFLKESKAAGYLSFNNDEVIWNDVRVLTNGNVVTTDGTFLGRADPTKLGNRYIINLSTVAGE